MTTQTNELVEKVVTVRNRGAKTAKVTDIYKDHDPETLKSYLLEAARTMLVCSDIIGMANSKDDEETRLPGLPGRPRDLPKLRHG